MLNQKGVKKFKGFLESLKGKGDDLLIESIAKGYQACLEVGGFFMIL